MLLAVIDMHLECFRQVKLLTRIMFLCDLICKFVASK